MKNSVVYIGTFGKYDLAQGAAKSIRINNLDDSEIILLNLSECPMPKSDLFDKIIDISMPKWMGVFGIDRHKETRSGVYIDDDMRLVAKTSLINRYNQGCYKISNGAMVVAWSDPAKLFKDPFIELHNMRMSDYCYDINDDYLCLLCSLNNCEQIDNIWIHIDKGSDPINENRKNLINYLDNNYLKV